MRGVIDLSQLKDFVFVPVKLLCITLMVITISYVLGTMVILV